RRRLRIGSKSFLTAHDAVFIGDSMPALRLDRVPLIVGVSGHRDLAAADEPPLRDALRALLDEIGRGVPHTQIVVLAVLRPGAGMLAAEVALDAGLDVIGCIPGTSEAYA